MPAIPPNKLKKFAGKKSKPSFGAAGKKFGGKQHDDEDEDDDRDESGGDDGSDDSHDHGHGGGGSDHEDGDDSGDGDDDHGGDDRGGGKGDSSGGGGGVDLKKAEKDSQAGSDGELESALADYTASGDPDEIPPFVKDHGLWNKAKKVIGGKWDSYDEPASVCLYAYKQLGGKLR